MNKKKIGFGIFLIVLVLTIWYMIPVHKTATVTMYSTEGEQIEAYFDISWHNFLLAPTELRGTVTITKGDSVTTYESIFDITNLNRDNHLKRISDKITGNTNTQRFCKDGKYLSDYNTINSSIVIDTIDKEFETVYLYMFDNVKPGESEVATNYYGPATTAEDALAIEQKLFAKYLEEENQ